MEWAIAHLSHDTMDRIVTQGWGGWAGRAVGATIQSSMPAIQSCDTAIRGPPYGRPARGGGGGGGGGGAARALKGLAARSWVAIQNCIVVERRATVVSRYSATRGFTTRAAARDTVREHGLSAGCVAI